MQKLARWVINFSDAKAIVIYNLIIEINKKKKAVSTL